MKLLGQALAVLTLYLGGIRIQTIDVLGLNLDLGFPSVRFSVLGFPVELALPSLVVTLFWFLGCMNVWNLIDGMDGLASGVGLLVSGTLTLVAIHNENFEVAVLAVALAGSLAGFLLYNWHPACIFLGDSGSMLIGLLIGVIGVQGSMEGPVGDLDPVSDPGDGTADLGHGDGDLPALGAQPALERGRPPARPPPA